MIQPTAKVPEQVNRKCPPRNTVVQPSARYNDPEGLSPHTPNPQIFTFKISVAGIAVVWTLAITIPDIAAAITAIVVLFVILIRPSTICSFSSGSLLVIVDN